jgi:phosphoglycerate dehydrogenase-like enzyme
MGDDEIRARGARPVDLACLMSTSDVVSVHAASTPATAGLVSADLLALIKPGATFINTSRGAVVDEAALIRELATGRFDAVLDVTCDEVLSPDSPLWDMPNVTLTPHWAGSLGRELHRLGHGAVIDVEACLALRPMPGRLDPALVDVIA